MRIPADDAVEISARYLKPGTLEVVMDEVFLGRISSGNDGEAVELLEQLRRGHVFGVVAGEEQQRVT